MVLSPNSTLQARNAFMPFLLYSKPYDLVSLATSAMFPYPNPLLGQAE
jgi:hypothetical protein